MKKIIIAILLAVTLIFAQPKVSGWDGLARCIDRYLENNLKDPDSVKIKSVSKVVYKDGKYYQRVDYTAKNSFGGTVRSNKIFIMDMVNGSYKVIYHFDYKR